MVNLQMPVGGGQQTTTRSAGSIHLYGTNGLATRTVWQLFHCITGTRKIGTVYTITVIPTIILSSVITTVSVPLMRRNYNK
jgi:hypothetical protein